jgi:hypothetical protein
MRITVIALLAMMFEEVSTEAESTAVNQGLVADSKCDSTAFARTAVKLHGG